MVFVRFYLNGYLNLFLDGSWQITPAHDPNDFEVGKRHNIDFINIFTDDGKINSNGGSEFEGMPRFKARAALIEALKNKVWLLANVWPYY